jgi:hypothetical protein
MKYEYREDGEPEGPLILIAPASNLVAILTLDWLDHTNEPAVSAKPHDWKNLANRRATREDFEEDSSGTPSTPSEGRPCSEAHCLSLQTDRL